MRDGSFVLYHINYSKKYISCPSFLLCACSLQAAKKMTTARAFQASTDLTEEELVDAVTKSSKSAAVGVAKVRTPRADRRGAL